MQYPSNNLLRECCERELGLESPADTINVLWEKGDNKALLHIFTATSQQPRLFGKLADNRIAATRLSHEAELLSKLRDMDPYLAETLPKPVCCRSDENQTLLLQEAVHGQSLTHILTTTRSATFPIIFEKITDWTAHLHQVTTEQTVGHNADGWKQLFRTRCRERDQEWGAERDFRNWEMIDWWLEQCSDLTLPEVIDHGDLTPHQVIVTNGHLTIVDWELAPILHLPLHDLVNFFLHARAITRGQVDSREHDLTEKDIIAIFLHNDSKQYVDRLKHYLKAMTIDPRFLVPILAARYPKIAINKDIGKKMIEILSVE